MSSKTNASIESRLAAAKAAVRELGFEDQFLKQTGLTSLDELDPKQFDDSAPYAPTKLKPSTSGAPKPSKELTRSDVDTSDDYTPESASDMLMPYLGLNLRYVSRQRPSRYAPSSHMMDYIVHLINDNLCDNFYFKRSCPDYHPYILRLYYGVLFWIQCLRAARDVRVLEDEEYQFLMRFLDAYPLESLTISSPLLVIFKTLCSSQPEFPTYGKVYPALPSLPGPTRRDEFMHEHVDNFFVPNIPGIIALLAHLNSIINTADPRNAVFPRKGKHTPVTANAAQATVFGHHSFPIAAERSNFEKWSLVSSGLQYPCEADQRLNETFAERYESFNFPATLATDDLRFLSSFLSMNGDLSWFAQVRDVAAAEADRFNGSGTLADCPPTGIVSNQICVEYIAPRTDVTAPTHNADPLSLFPFTIKLHSTARNLPALSEVMACTAQTHIRMFPTHPYFGQFGNHRGCGPFWEIRPIESSPKDESSYLSYKGVVRKLLKPK